MKKLFKRRILTSFLLALFAGHHFLLASEGDGAFKEALDELGNSHNNLASNCTGTEKEESRFELDWKKLTDVGQERSRELMQYFAAEVEKLNRSEVNNLKRIELEKKLASRIFMTLFYTNEYFEDEALGIASDESLNALGSFRGISPSVNEDIHQIEDFEAKSLVRSRMSHFFIKIFQTVAKEPNFPRPFFDFSESRKEVPEPSYLWSKTFWIDENSHFFLSDADTDTHIDTSLELMDLKRRANKASREQLKKESWTSLNRTMLNRILISLMNNNERLLEAKRIKNDDIMKYLEKIEIVSSQIDKELETLSFEESVKKSVENWLWSAYKASRKEASEWMTGDSAHEHFMKIGKGLTEVTKKEEKRDFRWCEGAKIVMKRLKEGEKSGNLFLQHLLTVMTSVNQEIENLGLPPIN